MEVVKHNREGVWPRATRPIIFAVLAVILILAALEGIARMAGYGPPGKISGYQESKFRPNKDILWELVPGWTGEEGAGKIRINSMGFRNEEIPIHKPQGETRIICLGDSVTFGYFVDQDQPWPKVLEGMYRASGKNVRIINAAVPGYSTFQEADQLRLIGWKLDPDVVILGYCLNDVTERYTSIAQYGGKEAFLGVNTVQQMPWRSRMLRKMALYRFIALSSQETARRQEIYSVRRLNDEPLPPELERAWEQNKAEILGLNKDVQAHGKRFMLVIFPYYFQLIGSGQSPLQQKRLMEVCDRRSISCLDFFPIFYSHRNEPLFLDGDHLSPKGHVRTAKTIYDTLEKKRSN